jgi:hypothetical protein
MERLSEFLAVERGGVRLYEAAIQQVRDPDLINRFREFYQQTRRHVELLTRVIASLSGDPMYMSRGAKVAEEKSSSSTQNHDSVRWHEGRGSGDQRDREYRNRGNQRSRRLANCWGISAAAATIRGCGMF